MEDRYFIKNVKGHLELYLDGIFICSGDSESEIREELRHIACKFETDRTLM